MTIDKQPTTSKDLIQALRQLPVQAPPTDLTSRIMASLPRRRGMLGRMEYAIRAMRGRPSANLLLPSSPAELGLLQLCAGVFFICLPGAILLQLYLAGITGDLVLPAVNLLPVLLASILLLVTGRTQVASPRQLTHTRRQLFTVAVLFILTTVFGLLAGITPPMDRLITWVGLCGLVITGGLDLARQLAFGRRRGPQGGMVMDN